MSSLTLTKHYADTELFYKSDFDDMMTELETKTNGGLDSDNVQSGWANLGQVTLSLDVSYTLGTTDSSYIRFVDSSDELKLGNTAASGDTIFKVESTEAARIESTSNDFMVKKDVYFKDRSTTISLYRILGTYQKPVLVYVSSDLIDVENNSETANSTTIVFPSGPIAVTEDVAVTTKFRRLSLSATANGYVSTHTGAADSGKRVGLSLSSNTWYFIYAVRVQYGDDAGNKFILVLDDTNPSYTNHSTLDSRYGTDEWVYLGTVRRGFGVGSTTTLVPFQQDHQGWTYFIDRGSSNDYFGVEVASTTVTSSSDTVKYTMAISNSGNATPANIVAVKLDIQCYDDGDGDFEYICSFWSSASAPWAHLPHLESDGGQMGFHLILPAMTGGLFMVHRASEDSGNDGGMGIYITGFQDHLV